jgi:hypothetical protein
MADSKRLAALKALTAHLENEITVANGYGHELTNAVFRGRAKFDDADPLPMISILESPNPDRFPNRAGEQSGNGKQKDNWTLLVQGWVKDDKLNPTDPGYELMADVKKALAKLIALHPVSGEPQHDNYLLGGLIVGLEYESGTVRPPDELSSKAFFWMRVIVKFVENINDPFDHS